MEFPGESRSYLDTLIDKIFVPKRLNSRVCHFVQYSTVLHAQPYSHRNSQIESTSRCTMISWFRMHDLLLRSNTDLGQPWLEFADH